MISSVHKKVQASAASSIMSSPRWMLCSACFALCTMPSVAQGQWERVDIGFEAGPSIVDLYGGDANFGFGRAVPRLMNIGVIGFALGIDVIQWPSITLGVETNLFVTQKGANRENITGAPAGPFEASYLQIPILIRGRMVSLARLKPYYVFGLSIGYLESAATVDPDGNSFNAGDVIRTLDAGAVLGIGASYELWPHRFVTAEVRGERSIFTIDDSGGIDGDNDIKNQTLSFLVGFRFDLGSGAGAGAAVPGGSSSRDDREKGDEQSSESTEQPGQPGEPSTNVPPRDRDVDRDADGITDSQDRCPDQAEDRNSFEDEDGCPEGLLDLDGDLMVYPLDRCPHERSVSSDGCLGQFKLVQFERQKIGDIDVPISIVKPILFKRNYASTAEPSHTAAVVDEIVRLMKYRPDLRARVEVYSTPGEKPGITSRRAAAILKLLTNRKKDAIDSSRFEVTPHDSGQTDQPQVPGTAATERRVDFTILTTKTPPPPSPSP